ncbi:hypothetical protein VP1G_10580 [Cytospora mali]|uniref:Uncharacterized protein n=1 Tax=Cytospora mali TaxID=578113 RepID=A0A194UPS0_CYTMA|nr:hypothetical protein VP1G_10580 [Valsa mali var. pyri (nom. inval.)]
MSGLETSGETTGATEERLPAEDRVLDDGVPAQVLVQAGEGVQGEAQADKVDGLVEEDAVGHDDGAIVLRLLDRVVAAPPLVVGPGLQHGELEVQVGVQREEHRERGQDDVADEGGHYAAATLWLLIVG